ncbi:MAG TPA: metallophosphoesterase, partial [Nevskiaceae bacterium]|nr:metallophosphoesterase [Nevskiaceae bacterium]
MALKLAVIGDVHGCWNDADTAYFNASDYSALLFVGDLAPLIGALPTARRLAALRKPAYLIPGNHDATGAAQFLAELRHRERLAAVLSFGQRSRVRALAAALGPVKCVGYTLDLLEIDGRLLGLIAARPHSMGGDHFYFRSYLKRAYGVGSFEESAEKLRALVDAAPRDLLFLAHNGPAGFGAARDDLWGCDFRLQGGDFGDPDLQDAVRHARSQGKR